MPKYGLQWKDRRGFARMAIKHGYAIVPCCCVGSEDFLEIAHDVDMGWMRHGLSIPLIKPDIRKMQKLYYWFSEPIETAQYGGDADNDEYANAVRDATRAAVEHGCGFRRDVFLVFFGRSLPGFRFPYCSCPANCRGIFAPRRKLSSSAQMCS